MGCLRVVMSPGDYYLLSRSTKLHSDNPTKKKTKEQRILEKKTVKYESLEKWKIAAGRKGCSKADVVARAESWYKKSEAEAMKVG
eukprot:8474760-Heterocapsa_arctica.AAC.1